MKKLFIALFIILSINSYSQQITGGSGICVITGNPNNIPDLASINTQSDCTTAYNQDTGDEWRYYQTRPLGDRWVMNSNGVDTNVDLFEVQGSDIVIEEAGIPLKIPISSIVHVNSISAGTSNVQIVESTPNSGDWIVNMTETDIQVTQNGNDITIVSQSGQPTTFSLNPAPTTQILPQGDITITQPSPNNYLIGFTESHVDVDISVSGQVSITNEDNVTKTFQTAATGVSSITGAGDVQVFESATGSGQYIVGFSESTIQITQLGNIVTIIDEDGVSHSFETGTFTIHGTYENDADAAANGCPINGYYEMDVDNTHGASVGDLRRRKN